MRIAVRANAPSATAVQRAGFGGRSLNSWSSTPTAGAMATTTTLYAHHVSTTEEVIRKRYSHRNAVYATHIWAIRASRLTPRIRRRSNAKSAIDMITGAHIRGSCNSQEDAGKRYGEEFLLF